MLGLQKFAKLYNSVMARTFPTSPLDGVRRIPLSLTSCPGPYPTLCLCPLPSGIHRLSEFGEQPVESGARGSRFDDRTRACRLSALQESKVPIRQVTPGASSPSSGAEVGRVLAEGGGGRREGRFLTSCPSVACPFRIMLFLLPSPSFPFLLFDPSR